MKSKEFMPVQPKSKDKNARDNNLVIQGKKVPQKNKNRAVDVVTQLQK